MSEFVVGENRSVGGPIIPWRMIALFYWAVFAFASAG